MMKVQLSIVQQHGAEDDGPNPRNMTMAKAFFRNAFNRVVEARERQIGRYIQGAMLNLDDRSLNALGTTRDEVRAKAKSSYVF